MVRDVDIDQLRARRIPSLVAVPYAQAKMAVPFRSRFDGLLAAFQVAVRYLAVVALSPMPLDSNGRVYQSSEQLVEHQRSARMSELSERD